MFFFLLLSIPFSIAYSIKLTSQKEKRNIVQNYLQTKHLMHNAVYGNV